MTKMKTCGCGGLVNMSPSRKSISGHLHICHEIVQDVKLCVSTNKCLLQPIVYLSPKDFPIGNIRATGYTLLNCQATKQNRVHLCRYIAMRLSVRGLNIPNIGILTTS